MRGWTVVINEYDWVKKAWVNSEPVQVDIIGKNRAITAFMRETCGMMDIDRQPGGYTCYSASKKGPDGIGEATCSLTISPVVED